MSEIIYNFQDGHTGSSISITGDEIVITGCVWIPVSSVQEVICHPITANERGLGGWVKFVTRNSPELPEKNYNTGWEIKCDNEVYTGLFLAKGNVFWYGCDYSADGWKKANADMEKMAGVVKEMLAYKENEEQQKESRLVYGEKHREDGFEWSVDKNGVLSITASEGGNGRLSPRRITETVTHSETDNGEEYIKERERILGYEIPWKEYTESISQVQIGEGIRAIPDELFASLGTLKKAVLPSTLEKIGVSAFAYSGLEEIMIPENVKTIENKAFEFCRSLRSIRLSVSLSGLGNYTFHGCEALREINIPEGVHIIWDRTFWGCRALKKVSLPDSLKIIRECAFLECKALSEIVLPEGLEEIGEGAFSGCDSLKSISVPDTVKKLGSHALISCEEAVIPRHITNLDEVFGFARSDKRIRYRKKSLFSFLFRKNN